MSCWKKVLVHITKEPPRIDQIRFAADAACFFSKLPDSPEIMKYFWTVIREHVVVSFETSREDREDLATFLKRPVVYLGSFSEVEIGPDVAAVVLCPKKSPTSKKWLAYWDGYLISSRSMEEVMSADVNLQILFKMEAPPPRNPPVQPSMN